MQVKRKLPSLSLRDEYRRIKGTGQLGESLRNFSPKLYLSLLMHHCNKSTMVHACKIRLNNDYFNINPLRHDPTESPHYRITMIGSYRNIYTNWREDLSIYCDGADHYISPLLN
jgi:hypothetical protein